MLRARRIKRASPGDLYRSCKLGGDCVPDVQNKIENTTLADRLLQIFGSILYLGNLGIGTGKGTGGQFGYRPFGGTATRGPEITVTKPAIPLDPLGGADVIPLDVINPEAPSIIPLTDGIPEIPTIDTTIPSVDAAEVDVTTTGQPTDILPTTNQQPTVIANPDITVIDFQPGPSPPKRIALDVGFSSTQAVQLSVFPEPKYFDPNINVFVDPTLTGNDVGFEEIELGPITNVSKFEIDEGALPTTSTPLDRLGRVIGQGRQLYNRFVQQVQTRNPEFIGRPSRLVTFDFENPAFEDEVTLQFQQDVNEVAAAPDTDFQDIISLSRPIFTETEAGIRLSRLGQKSSIRTRSGLTIGPQVHYYMDLSPIQPEIELQTYGIFSGESEVVNPLAESSFIDAVDVDDTYPDELLLDVFDESFENAHIVIINDEQQEDIIISSFNPFNSIRPVIGDNIPQILVNYKPISPNIDISTSTLTPAQRVNIEDISADFYLHPDLQRKRRKRKYIDF